MNRIVWLGVMIAIGCRGRGDENRAPVAQPTKGSGSAAPVQQSAAAMPPSWAGVVGDKPATTGPSIGNLKLGEIVDPAALPKPKATQFGFLGETEPRRLGGGENDLGPKAMVNLEIRAGKLFAFRIDLYAEQGGIPEDRCEGFARALEAKWGPAPERVWVDRTAHMRAAFRDSCHLWFEPYADVASWIGPEPTSVVPVFIVGKPAKGLASRVGPDVKLDEDVTYHAAGVGEHASGSAMIDVYIKKGTVTGVGVETMAGAADRAAIRERISSAFNAKPTRDATTGYDVWPTKPSMRMLATQTGVRVEVGNLTP